MTKEDLLFLLGSYINGHKIVKIEDDPFIKGQVNLWTEDWEVNELGDSRLIKFYITIVDSSERK